MNARMVVDNTISSKEMGTQMTSQGAESSSLTHVRSLVGQVQVFHTYTVTPRLVSLDHHNEAMMATMGLACIMSAFQEAAMFYTITANSTKRSLSYGRHAVAPILKVASESLAFIQGTGLDITIREYGLDLEPDQLRLTFYRIFHVKSQA